MHNLKTFKKKDMTTQRKKELMKDSLPNTPYMPIFMEQTYSTKRRSSMI